MIDWAPTLLRFFGVSVPPSMCGHDLKETIESDKKVRDFVLYGTFSGQVNITNSHVCYMRGAVKGEENNVYNYTLMPTHMQKRFSVDELKTMDFVKGFSFTKGLNVLKIKFETNDRKTCVVSAKSILMLFSNLE